MLLVNDLCKQAITETSLTLYSDSEMVRDFVTINDFCAALEFLIEDKGTGNVVHIGSGKSCTIGEMAFRIQKNCLSVLGFEPSIIFKKESTGKKSLLDFQTNYLNGRGFKFANDFDTEIKKLIHFCKQNFSKN
jgi:nucleoside-diphosphate-sugar epimerase